MLLVVEDTLTAVGTLSFGHSVLLRGVPQAPQSLSPLSFHRSGTDVAVFLLLSPEAS